MPDETNQVKEISVMTNKTASEMLYHELMANCKPCSFIVLKVMDNLTLPVLNKSGGFRVRQFSSVDEAKAYVNKNYTSDLEWVEYSWSVDNPISATGRAFDAEFKVYRL